MIEVEKLGALGKRCAMFAFPRGAMAEREKHCATSLAIKILVLNGSFNGVKHGRHLFTITHFRNAFFSHTS